MGKITENQTLGEELVEIMPKESLHLIERYKNNTSSIFDQKISLSTKISHKFLFPDSQNLNSGPSNLLGFKGRIFVLNRRCGKNLRFWEEHLSLDTFGCF